MSDRTGIQDPRTGQSFDCDECDARERRIRELTLALEAERERSAMLDRVAEVQGVEFDPSCEECIADGVEERDEALLALAAETGDEDEVPGWHLDDESDEDTPWRRDRDDPWNTIVWRRAATCWAWQLRWAPTNAKYGDIACDSPNGSRLTALEAMRAAEAAHEVRPRGKGLDQDCPDCHGWGYTCAHGGGPLHACELCDEPRECERCAGGTRPRE